MDVETMKYAAGTVQGYLAHIDGIRSNRGEPSTRARDRRRAPRSKAAASRLSCLIHFVPGKKRVTDV